MRSIFSKNNSDNVETKLMNFVSDFETIPANILPQLHLLNWHICFAEEFVLNLVVLLNQINPRNNQIKIIDCDESQPDLILYKT